MKVHTKKNTKTIKVKPNHNSSDIILANIITGCLGGCWNSYCYSSRYNPDNIYINSNIDEIIEQAYLWVETQSWSKIPNQQDPVYYMVDWGCATDNALMQKFMDIEYILKKIDNNPKLNSTFATKYSEMLNLDVTSFNKPPRVRVSLMPQVYSDVLEPKMQSISSRIQDINRLKKLGWEVHLNYSPVICYPGWQKQYKLLFEEVYEKAGSNKCEVIFLTNHKNQMLKADEKSKEIMKYSYEVKNQQGVMRYPLSHKGAFISEFKKIYSKNFNLNTIRYIF